MSHTRVIGGVYYCRYWQYEYKVLTINGAEVIVQLTKPSPLEGLQSNKIGDTRTHFTAWDWRDKIISEPKGALSGK